MTASLFNGSNGPFANVVDGFVYPQFITANRAPTSNDILNPGTRWLNNSVSPPIIYETVGSGTWNQAGGTLASTTVPGNVYLATLAQTESGGAPSADYVSSANDVATALAAVVVGAGVPATTAQQGYVYLASNAMVVPTYAGTLGANTAVPVSAIATMHAAPGPIGSVTPSTGAFTTLAASSNATVGGTLGVTGTSTIAALSATTGAFSSTLSVTGTSTIAALSATNGTFSGTLGVTGTSTIAALSATNGTFSGTLGVTGTTTLGVINSGNLTITGTLGVSGASSFASGTFSTTLGVTGLSTLAALTQVGTANINASGAAATNIATGGTGVLNIGNATGNTALTGALTISTTLGVTGLSTLAALTQAGTCHINITGAAATQIATGGTGTLQLGNATGNTALTGALTISTTLGVTGLSTLAAMTQVGTANINASGAAATNIATGGTGALNIGNATGNTALTGALTISTTLGVTGLSTLAAMTQVGTTNINASGAATTNIATGGTGVLNLGNATGNTSVTGSLTASTSLTATAGNITATNGDISIAGNGKKLILQTGAATDFGGTAVLVLGTVTVANTNIATGDLIFMQRIAANGSVTLGELSYTISNGASFTITSLILGTPASTQTADVSSVAYFIVRPI